MDFQLLATDPSSSARAGLLITLRGQIETPVFMPVGTLGTVKAVHQRELEHDVQAQIILGNTYHLILRPGLDILKQAGGLHQFMNWTKPILTDSGGYQVYSLGTRRKITEEGVTFRSHIDGSHHVFTPEKVMDAQAIIGADFMMALDECTPYPSDYVYAKKSMERTHRWLLRCEKQKDTFHHPSLQELIPIVQGGVYADLRLQSVDFVADRQRKINAIGGLSVGEPRDVMYEITQQVCDRLPKDKPRYLMGVGTPQDILAGITAGVDMFDCVIPTRHGRNGLIYTTEGVINIRNHKWKDVFEPLDPNLPGYVSSHYSKAYLRHLVQSHEILGAQIASLQNLAFYNWLVRMARTQIQNGTFVSWVKKWMKIVSHRL